MSDLAVKAHEVLLRSLGNHEGLEVRPEYELVKGKVAYADAEHYIKSNQNGFREVKTVQPLLSPH